MTVVYDTTSQSDGVILDMGIPMGTTFGFSFSTTVTGDLANFEVGLLNEAQNSSGTITAEIYSSNNGSPGAMLTTVAPTVSDSSLPYNQPQLVQFNLPTGNNGLEVSSGDQYFIELVQSSSSNVDLLGVNEHGSGTSGQYYNYSGTVYSDSDNSFYPYGMVTIACFCLGLLISTDRGEKAVEELAIGDVVVTASGQLRPIKWIGRRSYARRFLRANPGAQPIRFRAGSLGGALPRRDLFVSPEHAMFVDGVLVPAKHLVNGTTIVPHHTLHQVDYFHVELDSHDVLLAEGAPFESFVDDDNRSMFHNARTFSALYPAAAIKEVKYCALRVEDGFRLEAIRNRLSIKPSSGSSGFT